VYSLLNILDELLQPPPSSKDSGLGLFKPKYRLAQYRGVFASNWALFGLKYTLSYRALAVCLFGINRTN